LAVKFKIIINSPSWKRLLIGQQANAAASDESQPGIVTGIAEEPWFWWRKPIYLCTFAYNVKIAARPQEVEDFDHGYSLTDLEAPTSCRTA
jgi:hypothetical protein